MLLNTKSYYFSLINFIISNNVICIKIEYKIIISVTIIKMLFNISYA